MLGNETFEKLGIVGSSSNLVIYLTTVFNMKSITAATVVNIYGGTSNFGTIVAAFLCDSYFGRYKTLSFAMIACFLVTTSSHKFLKTVTDLTVLV